MTSRTSTGAGDACGLRAAGDTCGFDAVGPAVPHAASTMAASTAPTAGPPTVRTLSMAVLQWEAPSLPGPWGLLTCPNGLGERALRARWVESSSRWPGPRVPHIP